MPQVQQTAESPTVVVDFWNRPANEVVFFENTIGAGSAQLQIEEKPSETSRPFVIAEIIDGLSG
ncbi:MAG: hypothetical protein HQL11_05060 [Candidatus Omnitrophica bacterium]|nr:hypothetical protein [Candidatus Omnitrophota bacterium]